LPMPHEQAAQRLPVKRLARLPRLAHLDRQIPAECCLPAMRQAKLMPPPDFRHADVIAQGKPDTEVRGSCHLRRESGVLWQASVHLADDENSTARLSQQDFARATSPDGSQVQGGRSRPLIYSPEPSVEFIVFLEGNGLADRVKAAEEEDGQEPQEPLHGSSSAQGAASTLVRAVRQAKLMTHPISGMST